MNIYKISQTDNNDWDTYDAAIVYAPDEDAARRMHPDADSLNDPSRVWNAKYSTWCKTPEQVTVTYLGQHPDVHESKLILASFNAG